jgi:hypothetical protein
MGREFESPRAYQNPNLDGEIVLDPFLGSGSTLIALCDVRIARFALRRILIPPGINSQAGPSGGSHSFGEALING